MCIICQSRPAAFDGWCDVCKGRALHEVLSLRDIKQRVLLAGVFTECGCKFLSALILEETQVRKAPLPRPTPADLERLSHE